MHANEKGSTLVLVLLVILIFSVLGLSVIGSVVGENKRVSKTKTDVDSRNLARDGLTYFEADFKLQKPQTLGELESFISEYTDGGEKNIVPIDGQTVKITAKQPDITSEKNEQTYPVGEANRNIVLVTSEVIDEDSNKPNKSLIGYYEFDFEVDFDGPKERLAQFGKGKAINFANQSVLGLELLGILGAEVIKPPKDPSVDNKFYRVPDDSLINVKLLEVLTVNVPKADPFRKMNENEDSVIAMRKGQFLGADLLKITDDFSLLSLELINYKAEKDTNVIINGYYEILELDLNAVTNALDYLRYIPLLGWILDWIINDALELDELVDKLLDFLSLDELLSMLKISVANYEDIEFYKLGVLGNVNIQQDKSGYFKGDQADQRNFSFLNGLFVTKSIVIGGYQNGKYSNLNVSGEMVALEDLKINNVNLQMNDSKIYVYGSSRIDREEDTTTIENACIHSNANKFHVYSKGNLSIKFNHSNCSEIDGFFYAEDGIEIDTHGKNVVINGELIGDVTVTGGGTLTIKRDSNDYRDVEFSNIGLSPQGRSFD